MLLLVALVMVVSALVVLWPRRPVGGPPGPTPVPLIGTLAFIGARTRDDLFAVLLSLPRRFGGVVGFYAGSAYVVYLNGPEVTRRAMALEAANGRAVTSSQMALSFGKRRGLIVAEGDRWQRNSRCLMATLEHMLSTGEAESMIGDELAALADRLRDSTGPVAIDDLFRRPYVSLSWRIVSGERLQAADADRLTRLFQAEMAAFQKPWVDNRLVRLLLPEWSGMADVLRFRDEVRRMFAATVARGGENTFLGRFRQLHDDQWRAADDEDLVMFVFDFLNAGCETTSSFNEWAVLYLLRHADQLRLVRGEVDALGRPATADDRLQMPHTRAFLAEVFRHSSLTPASVPHRATDDLTIEGFRVPRGAVLRYDIANTHWSDQLWPAAGRFWPRRFLRDGQFVASELLMPYGVGPRCCTGRHLAQVYNFLSVTRLLREFDLVLPEGSRSPPESATIGLTRNCLPFQVLFRPR